MQIHDEARTYIVTEWCAHCESEIKMRWDTDTMGFQAFCPVCGNRLMLCDECRHTDEPSPCDYDGKSDRCHRSSPIPMRLAVRPSMCVDTPLGAIIVRTAYDPEHPGVWIDLRRPDVDCDMSVALIEFSSDDSDYPDGQPNLITRVWGDSKQEDYTTRVVHEGIEEFFRIEEVEENGR